MSPALVIAIASGTNGASRTVLARVVSVAEAGHVSRTRVARLLLSDHRLVYLLRCRWPRLTRVARRRLSGVVTSDASAALGSIGETARR
jgi:hypothetical protein